MTASVFLWLLQAASVRATGTYSCDVTEFAVDARSKSSTVLLQVQTESALNFSGHRSQESSTASYNASAEAFSSIQVEAHTAVASGQIAHAARLRLHALQALGLAIQKNYCSILITLLLLLFCCGNALAEQTGQLLFSAFNFVCTVGVLTYMLRSGIYDQWWNGADVGIMCHVLSIWVCITFCIATVICCCTALGIGVTYAIKNAVVKKIRLAFEEIEPSLAGPRREYYQSAAFTDLCDEIFDKADVDKSGSLDMSELKGAILEASGEQHVAEATPLFFEAFDENGDSTVEKGEFREMMKYFSVLRLEFEKQGVKRIERHYEVLQLRQSASLAEVKKAYHRLALRWHPDKRTGVPQETASADMREVQDAYEAICEHLKAK